MKPIIALDLDYTLVMPKEGQRWNVVMAELFEAFGVPRAATFAAYALADTKMQINVPDIAARLAEMGHTVDVVAAQRKLFDDMATFMIAYPEVPSTIAAMKKAGLSIVIITAGEETQQKQKARAVGIPYDHFFAVPVPEEKARVLRTLKDEYAVPILFADDSPHALDAVFDQGLEDDVTTLRMQRGPHIEIATRYQHLESPSLERLLDMLKERGIEFK